MRSPLLAKCGMICVAIPRHQEENEMADNLRRDGAVSTAPVPTYPDLAGKVAVVTGGSGGIGAATCRLLAANGVKVAVNGRRQAAIDTVVGEIRSSGGQAIGVSADCTDFAAIERMRQQVEQELGSVDVLAAFVAGGRARPGPTEQTTEEDWRSTIDGTLTATFLTVKSFLPSMIARRRGAIVTMASSAGRTPTTGPNAAYAAAKAGVVMFSRHVANEVGKHGVRVNCLSPSTILTGSLQQLIPEARQQEMTALHPLGRLGTPEDVALATLFLASESAAWLTGITLDVAGGLIMR
jgi:3-oxoacyl-[acyl-carrier protein] reductase